MGDPASSMPDPGPPPPPDASEPEAGTSARVRPAVVAFLAFSILTGVIYPILVLVLAGAGWPRQAQGSLVIRDGRAIGSQWVGQAYSDPGHFWGRPSATLDARGKEKPYNGANSGGSNLAPGSPAFARILADRAAALREADPAQAGPVPADLVTASGSGLDPHISPAAAVYQVHRVARRRDLDEALVRRLVDTCTEGPQLGVLGEPRVNVMKLNLALDQLASR